MSVHAPTRDGARLRLKVRPQARRDAIDGVVPDIDGEALAVSVTAAPEDGKANDAVIALLAKNWNLPRGAFAVTSGATSRRKSLRIAGDPDAIAAVIETWLASRGRTKPPE